MSPSEVSAAHEGPPDLSLLLGSRPLPPVLPLEVFGDRWAQWIKDAAEAAACPPDYVVAALLPAASALIGHARWAQAWRGWQEPPHLWCASVGHSGQGKSPGADLILRHVVPSIEAQMAREFELKADEQVARHILHSMPMPTNDLELLPYLIGSPIKPRFMESDLTIEKVADVLSNAAPKGLLMVRDELAGWLLGMNRFNAGARAFWLEAYGGRPYSLDRVKSAGRIYIRRLAVAWHGGVQPFRLAKLTTDTDDGLLARFMWFWPNGVAFKRPTVVPNINFAISAFERLSLLELGPEDGALQGGRHTAGAPSGPPIMVPLTEAAAAQLESFARGIHGQQCQSSGLINSALGKARGLVLRLSLVIEHLCWAGEDGMAQAPTAVGSETVASAIELVNRYLIPMAKRVYGGASPSVEERAAETLARWILRTEATEVHVRYLQRHMRLPGLRTADEIHKACGALVRAGWLSPPPRGSNNGRAKQVYRVSCDLSGLRLRS